MKKNKFSQWLYRLPVLLLVLILSVLPLSMAAPAHADVLSGSSVPSYSGFFCIGDILENGHITYLYVPSARLYGFCALDTSTFNILCVTGDSISVDWPYLNRGAFTNVAVLTMSSEVTDGNVTSLFFELSHYDDTLLPSGSDISEMLCFVDRGLRGIDTIPSDGSVLYFPVFSNPGVLSVFTGVCTWLSSAVQNISTMFWTAESGMTVLGYLAVASLALAVILLIFYFIAGWLKFH